MSADHMIRVLIVDDDAHIRAGVATLLHEDSAIEVIAQADDGLTAIRMSQDLKPDIIVMDISMPLIDGVTATKHILDHVENVKVLILSSISEPATVREIVDAGASGYVIKSSARRELNLAVRTIADGMVYLSPTVSDELIQGIVGDKGVANGQ